MGIVDVEIKNYFLGVLAQHNGMDFSYADNFNTDFKNFNILIFLEIQQENYCDITQ